MASNRVLVVDDEAHIRDVIRVALESEGFAVVEAARIAEARQRVLEGVSLVVLDVMLPDGDGLTFCRDLRARSQVPIVFVSARSEELDRVLGLELGGDDYLSKPFSPRELVARVRAHLRRTQPTVEATRALAVGRLRLDAERHEARCDATLVPLTVTEFGILQTLLERPGVVFSRTQLMQRAYAYDNLITERTIDTHVKRIRAKFREHGLDPIATVHGVGYKATEG